MFLNLLKSILPESIKRTIWRLRHPHPRRSENSTISDVTIFKINLRAELEVYWVSQGFGPGPGASLYIDDEEVMRFDCFGGVNGHYHMNLRQTLKPADKGGIERLYFPPGTAEEHIERAVFELKTNLASCLAKNRHPNISSFRIDPLRLESAADQMGNQMRQLLRLKEFPPN